MDDLLDEMNRQANIAMVARRLLEIALSDLAKIVEKEKEIQG